MKILEFNTTGILVLGIKMKKILSLLFLFLATQCHAAFYPNHWTTNANPLHLTGGLVSNAHNLTFVADTLYTNATAYHLQVTAIAAIPGSDGNTRQMSFYVDTNANGSWDILRRHYAATTGGTTAYVDDMGAGVFMPPGAVFMWTNTVAGTTGSLDANSGEAAYFNTGSIGPAEGSTIFGLADGTYPLVNITGYGVADTNQIGVKLSAAIGDVITTTVAQTNYQTFDYGEIITLSTTVETPVAPTNILTLRGMTINDVIITNSIAQVDVAAIGASDNQGPTNIVINRSVIYGQGVGANFQVVSPRQWTGTFSDTSFYANNYALITWQSVLLAKNCTFSTAGRWLDYFHDNADYSVCVENNDNSTNLFQGCIFEYGGSTNITAGAIHMLQSSSTYENCHFKAATNGVMTASEYVATTTNWSSMALYWAGNQEDAPVVRAYNCVFEPGNGLILRFDSSAVAGYWLFQDCYVYPQTNRVLFENNNYVVHISGGNFEPANFSNPTNVVWQRSGPDFAQLVGQTSLAISAANEVVTNYATFQKSGSYTGSAANGTITNTGLGGWFNVSLDIISQAGLGTVDFSIRTNLVDTNIKLEGMDMSTLYLPATISGMVYIPRGVRVDAFVSPSDAETTIKTRILKIWR